MEQKSAHLWLLEEAASPPPPVKGVVSQPLCPKLKVAGWFSVLDVPTRGSKYPLSSFLVLGEQRDEWVTDLVAL